ncbi:cell division initiation protein [Microbacterium panaciterrae]|uniref:Cell division initiation protein n=1 Tax=Microbacterium panaciterrae TaxID=985759 RepID=A0ABP8P0Z3_9MICO
MAEATEDKAQHGDFFDQLLDSPSSPQSFTIGFRGYDKTEVDTHLIALKEELRRATEASAKTDGHLREELDKAQAKHRRELEKAQAEHGKRTEQLESDLATAQAKVAESAQQIQSLSTALAGNQDDIDEATSRSQFETVLRVAEEQASVLIQNAAVQAERLLEAAREEAATKRAELEADVARITAQAERDADQVRLKMDTEFTAHTAQVEREAAHAQEKRGHAEQEAHAIRTEADKGAAALRAMVTRETTDLRVSAEREVREMNARVLEMEESITRRQDDAQQEFLVLHNQAVAHAERITADANEQVSAALAHAERISAKADDYERLMRSQAAAIEAEAQVRARETLDRARTKSQKIVDMVTTHTANVVRDADDRARQLRWQQQQLTSFMAEVRELIRPDGALGSEASGSAPAAAEEPAAVEEPAAPTAEQDA